MQGTLTPNFSFSGVLLLDFGPSFDFVPARKWMLLVLLLLFLWMVLPENVSMFRPK